MRSSLRIYEDGVKIISAIRLSVILFLLQDNYAILRVGTILINGCVSCQGIGHDQGVLPC